MKILYLAQNTVQGLIRNKILIVFLLVFVGILLLMLLPLLTVQRLKGAREIKESQAMLSSILMAIVALTGAFGSLVAIVASASAIPNEIKTGTILPVMATPITRWQFLVGRYLGVQFLVLFYVLILLSLVYLLAWVMGEKIQSSPLTIGGYLFVKYLLYSALALFFSVFMNAYLAAGLVLFIIVITGLSERLLALIPHNVLTESAKTLLYYILPSINLFDANRFIVLGYESIKKAPLSDHLIILGYGLDYTTVMILLAIAVFRKRSIVGS